VSIYYPACAVTLYVRLDEMFDALPAETLAGVTGSPTSGYWLPDATMEEAPSGEKTPRTLYVTTVPKRVSIKRNPYRQADEASIDIRWKDLPLDPRCIRSLAVAIYMDTFVPERWDVMMRGGVAITEAERNRTNASHTLSSLLTPRSLRYVGFADEMSVEHNASGDYITIPCRDFTSILIDTPVPSEVYKTLQWSGPIEDVVLRVMESLPAVAGCVLHLIGLERGELEVARGPAHKGAGAGLMPSRSPKVKEENYWDLLTDLTVGCGTVLYFDVYQGPDPEGLPRPTGRFVLARPKSIYMDGARQYLELRAMRKDGKFAVTETGQGTEYPFSSRARPSLTNPKVAADAPVFVYGANLSSLVMSRKFARVTVPSIELRCVSGGKTISGRYPPNARPAKVDPKGLHASDEIRVYTVEGVENKATLDEMAKQVFDDVGRGDMTVKFATLDLASHGGDNFDPDTLELRPGSPVVVLNAQAKEGETIGTAQDIAGMGPEALAKFLTDRGLDAAQAKTVADAMEGPQMREILCEKWYTKEVTLTFDNEQGFSCDGEAVNYLQARVQRELKTAGG